MSLPWRRGLLMCLILISGVGAVVAGDLELRFDPPREVTVRKKNGAMIQGQLTRFSPRRAQIEISKGVRPSLTAEAETLDVPLDAIRHLATTDGEFQFNGATNPQDLLNLATRLEGVTLEATAEPRPSSVLPSIPPGDVPQAPAPAEPPPVVFEQPVTVSPPPMRNDSGPRVLVTCGSCGKDVELGSVNGQRCPHCGVVWVSDLPPIPSYTPPPEPGGFVPGPGMANAGGNLGGAPQQPAPGGNGGAIQLNVPPPPMMGGGEQGEMTLANLPLWMKAGLFLIASAGCYLLLFSRG